MYDEFRLTLTQSARTVVISALVNHWQSLVVPLFGATSRHLIDWFHSSGLQVVLLLVYGIKRASNKQFVAVQAQDGAQMGSEHARNQPVEAVKRLPNGWIAEHKGEKAWREVAGRIEDGATVGTEGQTDETNDERHSQWLVALFETGVVLVRNGG